MFCGVYNAVLCVTWCFWLDFIKTYPNSHWLQHNSSQRENGKCYFYVLYLVISVIDLENHLYTIDVLSGLSFFKNIIFFFFHENKLSTRDRFLYFIALLNWFQFLQEIEKVKRTGRYNILEIRVSTKATEIVCLQKKLCKRE